MSFDISQFNQKAEKTIEFIKEELNKFRTGKASASMLDTVKVEAYGTIMRVAELATVMAPDANLITVSPWDKSILEAIAKGISIAGLNLNPIVDGEIIRIVVPALTEERRLELVKLVEQKIEEGRKLLRSVRVDVKKMIEDQKGTDGVSEDDIRHDLENLEKQVKSYTDQLEQLGAQKSVELKKL